MRDKNIYVLLGKTLSGKTTLLQGLKKKVDADFPVSFTSRPKRDNEIDGVDYHFISYQEALDLILMRKAIASRGYQPDASQGMYIWYYGLFWRDLAYGKDTKIVITDNEGLDDLKQRFDNVVSIYLDVDEKTQLKRLNSRQTELSEEQSRRMEDDNIKFEGKTFDYIIKASKNKNEILKEVLNFINEKQTTISNSTNSSID